MDIISEIQIKELAGKYRLPFIAIENVGLMSCEMLMS
jgi:hypothetical protein